jgi:hypothetical protein
MFIDFQSISLIFLDFHCFCLILFDFDLELQPSPRLKHTAFSEEPKYLGKPHKALGSHSTTNKLYLWGVASPGTPPR